MSNDRKYHIQVREADEGLDPAVVLSIRENGEEVEALIWSIYNPSIDLIAEIDNWEQEKEDF